MLLFILTAKGRACAENQMQSETQTCCILGGFAPKPGVQPGADAAGRQEPAVLAPQVTGDVADLCSALRSGATVWECHRRVTLPSGAFGRFSGVAFRPVCVVS